MIVYLFDIDGTLVRVGGAGSRSLERVMAARYGIANATRGLQFGGKTDPGLVGEIFQACFGRAPTATETAEVIAAYLEVLEDELDRSIAEARFRVLAGAVETVAWLRGRAEAVLGIATGNVLAGARAKLVRAGLWEPFGFGGYGDDSAVRAELVARAIERAHARLERTPHAVVIVGDTVHDISAARACGATVVAVATGADTRETLTAAEPDALIDSLDELPAWHLARFAERMRA
ncbi:MAG: HAD hydrolase-like protein [Deltaproteobacteria bacterium]|nr:HAD hydrolase-like protein [Deltaproteobacteria bacterium]